MKPTEYYKIVDLKYCRTGKVLSVDGKGAHHVKWHGCDLEKISKKNIASLFMGEPRFNILKVAE